VFLTPRSQQTFKWYAARGEVVAWKDVPQDAVALVSWWQRMQELYPPQPDAPIDPETETAHLLELSQKYGFQYILRDRTREGPLLSFKRVYPDPWTIYPWYEVYELPPADIATGELADRIEVRAGHGHSTRTVRFAERNPF
jgi:hypothetical protein